MRLSVSLIVKNEESCLETALKSVVGADELIVVDTGSTDRTKEIALSFGAKIFDFPWIDDFAAARNESLKHCTGDAVFIIDADEELEPGGLEKIREALATMGNARTLAIKTISRKAGYMHYSVRAFKRCPEIFWKSPVHNYLSVLEEARAEVSLFYDHSESHKDDPDRAVRMLSKAIALNPQAVREVAYLAREYWTRGDYPAAIRWYEDYLTRETRAAGMAEGLLMLAYCYNRSGNREKAKDCCIRSIGINTNFKEALILMASLCGPKNSERWKEFAETANNDCVQVVRIA
jgi:glycosyltransferase involved in cell wall biosynthesis